MQKTIFAFSFLFLLTVAGQCFAAMEIWSIGQCDANYAEFFAATDHRKVAQQFPDEIPVDLRLGKFNAATDFPWLLPGPADVWGGAKSRTVRVMFALANPPADARAYVLEIRAAAQSPSAPMLEVALNGTTFTQQTLPGATGDAILTSTDKAVWTPYRFVFPANALRAGNNVLTIRSTQGSWLVFDCLQFSAATGNVEQIGITPMPGFSRRASDGAVCRHVKVDFGGEILMAPATLSITGAGDAMVQIPRGSRLEAATVEVPLGKDISLLGENLDVRATLTLKNPDGSAKTSLTTDAVLPALPKPWIDEVVLVFKTHFDIGYTKLASEVVENYRTGMIDNALAVVDASEKMPEERKFVWTLPGWPTAAILKDQTPERAARLDRAIGEGRFAVHALPFTMHTETLTEEDLVRGLRFSSNIAKQYGFPLPTDAKMTDVPCHSWFVPTLLAHAGVTFMHEGTNTGCSDPEVPVLYFREGPDGSRVLTMHVNGYGGGLEPPADWPYRTWMWLIHTGDNHGPPRPGEVESYLKAAHARFPHAKIHIGRLSDFGDAILAKENTAEIPVVTGDMPDTWIFGPMSDPQGQRTARAVHEALTYAEMFDSLYGEKPAAGEIPESARKIADAREQSLLYGEHTWGAAIYWLNNRLPYGEQWKALENGKNFTPAFHRAVASWEEHSNYIRQAAKACMPENPDADEPKRLFNPLPWSLVDYRGQTLVPGAVTADAPEKEAAKAVEVTEPTTIASPYFSLKINPATGDMTLEDLKNKRSVFQTQPGFLYHRADAALSDKFMHDYCISFPGWVIADLSKAGMPRDVPEKRVTPEKIERVVVSQIPGVSKTIRIEYAPGEDLPFDALAVEIVLYEHRPEVRFAFDGKAKKPDTWPEAGYFHFPLAIENPQFRLGRLGGIVDPATEIVRGSNRHFQWLRTGVAVYGEDGYGIGVCPLDSPMVSLDKPGGWLFSKDFVPQKADLWFNLFNNQWTTNFRFWNEGDIRAAFILWTFDGYDNERSLITPSLEAFALNFQPEYPAALAEKAAAEAPRGIQLDRKGIYVSAFGVDPDSGQWMLRMWEMAGMGADAPPVTVQLPKTFPAKAVIPCDLRGRPVGEAIPVKDGMFRVNVKPYAPVNLRVMGL